ncbi:MAG: hypothetical protein WHU93_04365 [Arcobacteraceae bacterium]
MKLNYKVSLLSFFVINIILIAYYQIDIYPAFFNSDAAIANILADEIASTSSYYPTSWWYVNGDIWTLFKHTLIIPFSVLGLHGYYVHVFAVLIFAFFTFYLTYVFLKKIGISTEGILIALVGISTLYSPMYVREMYGESAYIWYYTALLGYLFLFILLDKQDHAKHTLVKLGIVLIGVFFVAENPSRFGIYFIVPLFLPLMYFYKSINFEYKKIIIYFALGVVLGLVYRYFISDSILMQKGVNSTLIIPLDKLPEHIWYSIIGLINLYGTDWGDKTPFVSIDGVTYLLKFLLYPVAFFAPIYYALKNKANMTFSESYTLSVGYVGFIIVFGIYCITTLHIDGLYAAKENIRYVIPFTMFISVSNGVMWKYFSQNIKIILLFSVVLSYISIFNTLDIQKSKNIIDSRVEVIQTLKENGLSKGYAPYWHSHIFTVLSDNSVEVRPLESEYIIKKGTWLTSTTWYDNSYSDKNTFVLMPLDKVEGFEKVNKSSSYIRKIELQNYNIYIYNQNPINN